jgi:serine phosphatase RsbU (regulator of sigma subunit)
MDGLPMNGRIKPIWLRYGSAVVAVLLATLVCLLLDPILEGHHYYVWFLLAIVFTGWYAGFRPCLVCFVLTVPAIDYFFAPPRFAFGIHGMANQLGFVSYCLIGTAVLLYTNRLAGVQIRLARQQERQRAAREIQQALLPKGNPQLTGFEISGRAVFAEDVGGDCFDYIPIVTDVDGCLAVLIADAVGHGMCSALLISRMCAFLRVLAVTGADVGCMLQIANYCLRHHTPPDYFVTAFVARLDAHTHSVCYANAGHCPGHILDVGGQVKAVLNSSTQPLGIDETNEFVMSDPFVLQPGELVVLVTDGIVEAGSAGGQQFGIERILSTVRRHHQEPLDAILDSLFSAVTDFTHRADQEDDMTVVLIKATHVP